MRWTIVGMAFVVGCSGSIAPGDIGDTSGDGTAAPVRPGQVGTPMGGTLAPPPGVAGAAPGEPGFGVVRRLSRTEYCNSLNDLLGTSVSCATLPTDGALGGFDTIGSVQSVSQLHLELYEQVTSTALGQMLAGSSRSRVVTCDGADDACVKTIVRGFGRRAWRRPMTDAEAAAYAGIFAEARALDVPRDEALKAALQGILLSPHFSFRLEPDANPAAAVSRALDAHELAARLSYALWATLPDEELMRAADSGALTRELEAQVQRMLDHPKARSLIADFAAQWLQSRELRGHEVDTKAFPQLTPEMKGAMADELEAVFTHYLRGKRPYKEMVAADFTVGVNDKLAAYYGIPAANADGERPLKDTPRRGLVGKAGFHVVTSRGDHTSFVARGVWVLENLLCRAPAQPPPDIPPLPSMPGKKTKRQLSEEHRTSPSCAICHIWIDPIGLGLENFDPAGAWRTIDEYGNAVEALGELPGPTSAAPKRPFRGPVQLAQLLAADSQFERCVADRFLSYSLGRMMHDDPEGHAWVEAITADAAKRGGTLRDLLIAVVTSKPFRSRRPEGSTP